MAEKYTHTAAFKHFGVKARNVQWSWSARNDDTKTVVVTFWQDEFKKVDGRLVYSKTANWHDGNGYRELIDNFEWAQRHCGGRFKVIIAVAKDPTVSPRSIKECFPSPLEMRLTVFDPVTGSFAAETIGA